MDAADYITIEEVRKAQTELSVSSRKWLLGVLRKCAVIFVEVALILGLGLYFLYPWPLMTVAVVAVGSSALMICLGATMIIFGTGKPLVVTRSELKRLEARLQAGDKVLRPNNSMQPTGQQPPAAD